MLTETRPSTQTSELARNLPRTNVPRYAASCSGSRYQPSRTDRNVKPMRNSKKSSQQSNTANYCEYKKEISNKEPHDSGFNTSTESESVTLQKSQEGESDCYITTVNLNEHNDNDCKMARNDSQVKVHEEKLSFPQRSINFDVAKELWNLQRPNFSCKCWNTHLKDIKIPKGSCTISVAKPLPPYYNLMQEAPRWTEEHRVLISQLHDS